MGKISPKDVRAGKRTPQPVSGSLSEPDDDQLDDDASCGELSGEELQDVWEDEQPQGEQSAQKKRPHQKRRRRSKKKKHSAWWNSEGRTGGAEQDDDGIGLRCPECNCKHVPVKYTRHVALNRIKRHRQCRNCSHEFDTFEG